MLRYFRKSIALAGVTGLILGFAFSLVSLYVRSSYWDPKAPVVLTVAGVSVNLIVIAALSRVYMKLSGATWSWGVLLECVVAQFLAFLAFWAVFFDALS